MQRILLHSTQVEDSRSIVSGLGLAPKDVVDETISVAGEPLRIVGKHSLATSLCPNFSAYPCMVVIEDDGTIRALSGVKTWAECATFANTAPVVPGPVQKQIWTQDELLNSIHWTEKAAIIEFTKGNSKSASLVQAVWEELHTKKEISRSDLEEMVPLFVSAGIMTELRVAEILG